MSAFTDSPAGNRREFLRQTSVMIQTVNRLTVLTAALTLGGLGVHKFLLGARREGLIYLALVWTGIPVLCGVMDFVALLMQPAIGRGLGGRRLIKRHIADMDVVERGTWYRMLASALLMALLAVGYALGLGKV
ncbi:MAG: NINE protein [Burkholderiales bacterium]|nr:NINE protein [Burkholderiales bacterium]